MTNAQSYYKAILFTVVKSLIVQATAYLSSKSQWRRKKFITLRAGTTLAKSSRVCQ